MSHLKSHRGFTIDAKGRHGYVEFPMIDTLYHHMETSNDFANKFDYVKDAVQAAKQILFDRNGQFILARQLHTPCSYWVFNFTVSTLAFLSGKPRTMSLENYRDLMVFHPKDIVSTDPQAIIREHGLGWAFGATPGEIVSRWLTQEDGLTDLVISLWLIGGSLPKGWHDHTDAA